MHLNKLESIPHKDALCQVWLILDQWFWRRRFLNIFNIILYFRYCLPLDRGVALHLNKLESPPPKDALCQIWLKLAMWFWRRRFFKSFNRNYLFRQYLPLEKGVAVQMNKLESPPPKDALCQISLKVAQWCWRRFLNIFNIILHVSYYLRLEKGVALHLNKL